MVSDLICWLTWDFIFVTRVTLAGYPAIRGLVRADFNGLLFLWLFTSKKKKKKKKGSTRHTLHLGKEMQEKSRTLLVAQDLSKNSLRASLGIKILNDDAFKVQSAGKGPSSAVCL